MNEIKPSYVYSDDVSDKPNSHNSINVISKTLLDIISLSHTSNGVLFKWSGKINNSVYYFKSGNLYNSGYFSNRQPYSELMSYRIGKQLNFPNLVETKISSIHLTETDKYLEQNVIVSHTKDFKPSNRYSYKGIHYYFTDPELKANYNNLYGLIANKFSEFKLYIDLMILFDFITANIDRHLNNFGFISDGDDLLFSPLFDNGLSLLSHLDERDISSLSEFALKKSLKCKPFSSDPNRQLKLIDFSLLPCNLVINLIDSKINWNLVFDGLDLSDVRKSRIIELVEGRLSYVKDLLFKVL